MRYCFCCCSVCLVQEQVTDTYCRNPLRLLQEWYFRRFHVTNVERGKPLIGGLWEKYFIIVAICENWFLELLQTLFRGLGQQICVRTCATTVFRNLALHLEQPGMHVNAGCFTCRNMLHQTLALDQRLLQLCANFAVHADMPWVPQRRTCHGIGCYFVGPSFATLRNPETFVIMSTYMKTRMHIYDCRSERVLSGRRQIETFTYISNSSFAAACH